MALSSSALTGVFRLALEHHTTGDLLFGPWANVAFERFLIGWLSASALALAVFIVYAWLWLRLIFRDRQSRPGLIHFGLVVAATISFTSLQRSLRLGQLDSFVLCLLAAGTYHATRCLRQEHRHVVHGVVGGLLLALATGVKILPGVTVLGLMLAAWQLRQRALVANRSLVALLAGGLLGAILVAGTALLGLGTVEIGRFFAGLPLMLRGSAAGVNYAVIARFAKYADPSLRLTHAPLSASTLLCLWPLRALALLALLAATRRIIVARLHLLFALSLALLPLVSSLVWDTYFVWCAYFPWLLLLVSQLASRQQDRPLVRILQTTLLAGSYFLMGVAGTGLVRNPVTNRVADTGLPMWFDEARLVGLFMVIGMLLWELMRPEPPIAAGEFGRARDPRALDQPG